MDVFLQKFIDNKKYILIAIITVFIAGILYGFYQYNHSSHMVKVFFENLFHLNLENYENKYQFYLIQNLFLIFICTYLSSSYLGHIGILFLTFLKGIQLSFSIIHIYITVSLSFITIILLFIEILIEIVLCIVLSLYHIHISIYVTLITFYIEQNFNIKSMLNYRLNNLIASLIIFIISLAFRLYIIPMF